MIELSIILPTYNEKENIPIIIDKIEKILEGFSFEIVIVDDNSPDGSWEIATRIATERPSINVIRRIHEKGLSSAIVLGFEIAKGEYMTVMDADLQHDENALPRFIDAFRNGADIVVGSRKADNGGLENWPLIRQIISWAATLLASFILPQTVSDPMSGFFGISKFFFNKIAGKINPRGFKLLLEILVHSRNANIKEIGYIFKKRIYGNSKLSSRVVVDYLISLYELRFGRFVPVRFIKFGIIGLSGIIVNLTVLWSGLNLFMMSESSSLIAAIELSVISNFFLNNMWTYKDKKLTGLKASLKGLLYFNVICLAGVFINFITAMYLKSVDIDIFFADIIGIFLAALWNYFLNSQITWR